MGLSAVSSNPPATLQSSYPVAEDWKALQNALQSNDVASAQTAFATLQGDLQKSAHPPQPVQPAPDGPVARSFRALDTALQAGDLPAAKTAFQSAQAATLNAALPTLASSETPISPEGTPTGLALNTIA